MSDNPVNPSGSGPRVRIVRDGQGRVVGFQDPDQNNRFISRSDAVRRLEADPSSGKLFDSFDQEVGVGSLRLPGRGVEVTYKTKSADYAPLPTSPDAFTPKPNQEIIERDIFIDRSGKLVTSETSYGLGEKYDPARTGGRFRQAASDALGVEKGQRLPTKDLQRALAMQEFIVKTISS